MTTLYLDGQGEKRSGRTTRAVGYIRFSTEDEAQGSSSDAQRIEIERYCEQQGYELIRIYFESASAHTDRLSERPELRRLLQHARLGAFDVAIVHALDHWARDIGVQTEALQILGEANVGFASVMENIDFATPTGRVMITMMGAFAEFFSAQSARHVQHE